VIVQVSDKELTPKIIGPLQSALSRRVPGAWITVRQLQTNPVETPVEILISGQADVDAKDGATDIQTYAESQRKRWMFYGSRLGLLSCEMTGSPIAHR
jgi:hypothetical protein